MRAAYEVVAKTIGAQPDTVNSAVLDHDHLGTRFVATGEKHVMFLNRAALGAVLTSTAAITIVYSGLAAAATSQHGILVVSRRTGKKVVAAPAPTLSVPFWTNRMS
ncbi:hypothetical protein AB0C34_05935 [Nocardia sp. NPDC049220]|uniref:hypothetical protein n=1 Tax=Nocardia sp. NPDC049220 TaxID=3155273 RepID=UPI0033E89AFF